MSSKSVAVPLEPQRLQGQRQSLATERLEYALARITSSISSDLAAKDFLAAGGAHFELSTPSLTHYSLF